MNTAICVDAPSKTTSPGRDSSSEVGAGVKASMDQPGLSIADIELLYHQFSAAILRRCKEIVRDEQAAWDAMHQTFINAITHRRSFKGRAQPLTWLYSIAFRVCFDKRKKLRQVAAHEVFEPGERPTSDQGGWEAGFLERCTVTKLLHSFDRELGEVAALRYLDELELEEIADVTGISRRTVIRRLKRFHDQARALIEGQR